jgi:iron complex transport system substrate-binding protein
LRGIFFSPLFSVLKTKGGNKEEKMKRRESSFGKAFLKPFCFAKAFMENTSWKKRFAMVEIAIVLCSVFLVATLPAIAADQTTQKVSANLVTTASENDYVLGVYGNANEDDTIDMRDLTYVKLIFFGKKSETELADAKYDGKINPLDFIQIKLIIVGKEKELTVVDTVDRIVTVKKPVERIVAFCPGLAPTQILDVVDKVVGVTKYTKKEEYSILYPELSKLPRVGSYFQPDYEKILELEPDLVITYGKPLWKPGSASEELVEILKPVGGVAIGLNFYTPFEQVEEMKKLGYILDKEKEAEEFTDFYKGVLNPIKEKTEKLSEEDKPRIYYEQKKYQTFTKLSGYQQIIDLDGGINIAADLAGMWCYVDPEWVMIENPDIVLKKIRHGAWATDNLIPMKEAREEFMNRPELANVTAVKDGKVYVFSIGMGAHTHFITTAYIAKWFHPTLFEDLDPKAIHQEYLTKFLGLDYDLDKHGVFVYHPEQHPDGH